MSHNLKTEKVIARPVGEVFEALKAGLLFMNCGSDSASTKIDFQVGGKYSISFKNKTLENFGEFIEIIPNKRIVFSWCQTFGENQKPDTTVTIDLVAEGSKTKVLLAHTGFVSEELCAGHMQGWTGGLADMASELEIGRLRFLRTYELPAEKLFDLCKRPEMFDGHKVVDAVSGAKLILSGGATLMFAQKPNNSSTVEILQDGLKTMSEKLSQRKAWETAARKLTEAVQRS